MSDGVLTQEQIDAMLAAEDQPAEATSVRPPDDEPVLVRQVLIAPTEAPVAAAAPPVAPQPAAPALPEDLLRRIERLERECATAQAHAGSLQAQVRVLESRLEAVAGAAGRARPHVARARRASLWSAERYVQAKRDGSW